jgi:hypothetical protein
MDWFFFLHEFFPRNELSQNQEVKSIPTKTTICMKHSKCINKRLLTFKHYQTLCIVAIHSKSGSWIVNFISYYVGITCVLFFHSGTQLIERKTCAQNVSCNIGVVPSFKPSIVGEKSRGFLTQKTEKAFKHGQEQTSTLYANTNFTDV